MVYITRDLLTVLLEHAADAEPSDVNVPLSAMPARDLVGDVSGIDPATPVLTHFTLPDVGRPVNEVFGVDLGTPAGRSRARFLSHPTGELRLTDEDDLAAVVLVAVAPWEESCVAAFDRAGRKLPLSVVDAEPPEESVPD